MSLRRFLRVLRFMGWALVGFPGVVGGTPLTWSLFVPPVLGPTGSVRQLGFSGDFVYDANTNVVSQWDIITLPPMLPPQPPQPLFYGPHDPVCYPPPYSDMCASDSVSASNSAITFTHVDVFYGLIQGLFLVFSAPLTDAGGTIPLIPGRATGGNCPPGPCGSIYVRQDEANPLAGVVSAAAVPEPATATYLIVGGLMLGLRTGLRWGKRSARSKVPPPV